MRHLVEWTPEGAYAFQLALRAMPESEHDLLKRIVGSATKSGKSTGDALTLPSATEEGTE